MSKREELLAMDDEGKISAVYYFYLSLDNLSIDEKQRHFETIFDIRQNLNWYLTTLGLKDLGETLPKDDVKLDKYLTDKIKNPEDIENFSIAMPDFSDFKDDVIRFCEEVINEFEDDERYERIKEEIDRILLASPRGITSYDKRKYLWQFIMYSVTVNLLTENRRRFLKHFVRIAEIDKKFITEMENTALSFVSIGKRRFEAKNSDKSYSKVVATLSGIDLEEIDSIQQLYKVIGLSTDEDGEKDDNVFRDDGTTIFEKIDQGIMNVLERVADKLDDFSWKL